MLAAIVAAPAPVREPAKPDIFVLVAARTLPVGHVIEPEDVVGIWMPLDLAPPMGLDERGLAGRVVAERILRNEVVLAERLADAETGWGVNALVPRGMRGIIVRLPKRVHGLVWPEDPVDLVVGFTDANGKRHTAVVAQNRSVLSVLDDHVMVAVAPEEAERIAHGLMVGEIFITLRTKAPPPGTRTRPRSPLWTGE